MKNHKPQYSNDSVMYWPSFVGGIGAICFCGYILFIYLICFIVALDKQNVAHETTLGIGVITVIVLVGLIFSVRGIIRTMFCCVIITREDFSIVNKITRKNIHITWVQALCVEFKQEMYRGRKQYRVYLKADHESYIVLPINMVDENRLNSIIPKELLPVKRYGL